MVTSEENDAVRWMVKNGTSDFGQKFTQLTSEWTGWQELWQPKLLNRWQSIDRVVDKYSMVTKWSQN